MIDNLLIAKDERDILREITKLDKIDKIIALIVNEIYHNRINNYEELNLFIKTIIKKINIFRFYKIKYYIDKGYGENIKIKILYKNNNKIIWLLYDDKKSKYVIEDNEYLHFVSEYPIRLISSDLVSVQPMLPPSNISLKYIDYKYQ